MAGGDGDHESVYMRIDVCTEVQKRFQGEMGNLSGEVKELSGEVKKLDGSINELIGEVKLQSTWCEHHDKNAKHSWTKAHTWLVAGMLIVSVGTLIINVVFRR